MAISMLISTLLLTTCGAAVALSLYGVHKNLKPLINRLFLAHGCAVLVWALGQAVTVSAATVGLSAIGRSMALLGWVLTACLALHIILLLTGQSALLRQWWSYLLVYGSGAVVILFFSILPLWGINPHMLEKTTFGWVDAAPFDGWDWLYYIHIAVFIVISLALLLRWQKPLSTPSIGKQARLIGGSFILTAVCSIAADLVPSFLGIRFPHMSAAFILFPIFTVGYSIQRYDLMRPAHSSPNEMILSKAARTYVCRYMSLTAYAISVVLLVCKNLLFPDQTWGAIVWFSAFWVLSGTAHAVINRLKIDDTAKEMLEAIHFAFLIPLVCLWFNELGIFTTWAIVFPMMIFGVLFNQYIMLTTAITASALAQLISWVNIPTAFIEIFGSVYLLRAVIILFTAIISMYVHWVFTRRLKENANHMEMQTIASEISHTFINAGEHNLAEKLYATLERCGQHIHCDRAYLAFLNEEQTGLRDSIEWLAPGVPSQLAAFETSFHSMHDIMLQQLQRDSVLVVRDAALLPPMAGPLKKQLAQQHIRALIILAIRKQGEIIGFLGFNARRPLRQWNLDTTTFLDIITGIVTDAILKVDGEREINFIAYHDQLTRLPSRNLFQDRLLQAISFAKRSEKMLGVVFVDLDSFKTVNDTMGHDLGDTLLIEVAQALTQSIRSYDTVARFGGDEFIILLKQLSSVRDLERIMDGIMAALQKPVMLSGQEFFITASAGVALFPQDGQDPETLTKNADAAMYMAKKSGKNRYALCSQDLKDDIFEKMRLTNLLYRAQERQQFVLYYQPQLDTESREIVGFEALIRWRLPDQTMVGPGVFIPLAEQTGLIQGIGEWVLRTACAQNKRWQEMGFPALRMAVNVSLHQLHNPRFVDLVDEVRGKAVFPPHFLSWKSQKASRTAARTMW